ncbi:MAG: hypothetical protein HOV81_34680, partial [Kofleriaceae bacterium]|nr:hypothetical protein [Kofleriaceae bacterium]
MLVSPAIAEAQPEDGGATSDSAAAPAEPAKVTAVEPPADAAPKLPPPDPAKGKPVFELGLYGFMRLQYIVVQNDPNVAFVGRDDGFELQNARVGVHGKLSDRASFTFSIDGAVDERAQNTPQGKLRLGMRDAFADVSLGTVFVRGGYFQTWVDPQGLVPDIEREFVDKPLESRGMRSTEGWYTPGLPPGRSLGAAVRLEPKTANRLGFEIAVQNGADEFASNNDNDKPALSVAAMLSLPNNGFVVAAGRWNPRTVGDLPFRQDETDLQGSVGAQLNTGAISLGGGAIV